MPNFTLALRPEKAEKARRLTSTFGGSVGGFAARYVNELCELEPAQLVDVLDQLRTLARANQNRKKTAAGGEKD